MITVFSIPKAFAGDAATAQSNAIESWKRAAKSGEIIIFGDDPGAADICRKLDVRHEPRIAVSEAGTPLVSAAFDTAQKIARGDILVYINADIVLMPDFEAAVNKINLKSFLAVGRRTDMSIPRPLDFSDSAWAQKLMSDARLKGRLHGYSGIDYFIFRRDFRHGMPPFAVGRPGWDNWLLYRAKETGVPIVDASAAILAVHQDHDLKHTGLNPSKRDVWPESRKNFELAGLANMMSIRNADLLLSADGIARRGLTGRIFMSMLESRPGRAILAARRKISMVINR
ncbi:MAG: hypothetical protein CVU77_01815 [Elusimicrobia bacterium HGW-Elusimicrobia-1]|jgi:hypothetical protein|nr:MAG: hypothetical protein CVU77_01815 [Elusimicrobia bacterium HGW-Elusimicrobia-1]